MLTRTESPRFVPNDISAVSGTPPVNDEVHDPQDARLPSFGAVVDATHVHRVQASRYDALTLPLLSPEHIAYTGSNEYLRQLARTPVAWNSHDMFLPGPDGVMVRQPMSQSCPRLHRVDLAPVPLPELNGVLSDPSRRVAQLEGAHGEYRMDKNRQEMTFLVDGTAVPSILADYGVYDLGAGKWLVSRRGGEDPLAACLRMVQVEDWPADYVRHLPPLNPLEPGRLLETSLTQAQECLRMMPPGSELIPLGGMTHKEAMAVMDDLLARRRCGILFTQGLVRVVDAVQELDDGRYAIAVRDAETCSARLILDHQEFWLDQAASPSVTAMPDDRLHGTDDILLIPPIRFGFQGLLA